MKKILAQLNIMIGRHFYTVLLLLALISAVSLNAVAGYLSDRFDLRVDMTQNRMYELSEATMDTLAKLEQPLEVYTLFRTGAESKSITSLLKKMQSKSSLLRVSNVDPLRDPAFTVPFDADRQGISENAIIVTDTAHERYKVIAPTEFYSVDANGSVTGFVAEAQLLSAMRYVLEGRQRNVFLLQGHGEAGVNDLASAVSVLQASNYTVADYPLAVSAEALNPQTDALLIVEPKADISAGEYDLILQFLRGGGRLMICSGAQSPSLERLNGLLSRFNCRLDDGLIQEEDATYYVNEKTSLVPRMGQTDITIPLAQNRMNVVMPAARPISPVFASPPEGIAITATFATSEYSRAQIGGEEKAGPFVVGIAAVEQLADSFSYVLAYGSSRWLTDSGVFENPGNYNLLLTSVAWLFNDTEEAGIAPKPVGTNVLSISNSALKLGVSIFVLAIVPLLLLSAGFAVMRKRRRL